MKEIGLRLKLKREENGVSIEEAADDLKIRVSQLQSIEDGRDKDFEDVFSLKYFIRDYAKYLGLDGEEMLDSFNEYIFEQTSKISLEEIEEAKKIKEEKEKDMKILSPYTVTTKEKKRLFFMAIFLVIIAIISILVYIIVRNDHGNDDFVDGKVSYENGVGGIYEFS